MILILGGAGFVGSAYQRLLQRRGLDHAVVTRENYADLRGKACRVLINANGNSKKFMADRDPTWEFDASVVSVVKSLEDFRADAYVYLSTGDVYPRQDRPAITREDASLEPRSMSRYGLHKFVAETLVRSVHPHPLVIRMGGFVGPGLKKNAIFDMLNDQLVRLHPDSELQFIRTDVAAEIVWGLVEAGVANETVNLGAKGVVRIGDVHEKLGSKSPFAPDAAKVRFEISTEKLERLCDASLPASIEEVDAFLTSLDR